MYSRFTTRFKPNDSYNSNNGTRYAMARLQELKQQAQQRNLVFLGSDVKQELNNIIDNFTTNFMDITYNEVVSFLEIVRPW